MDLALVHNIMALFHYFDHGNLMYEHGSARGRGKGRGAGRQAERLTKEVCFARTYHATRWALT